MDIWKTLGIERTNDTSLIKKAYARKLRVHHPEDDPEGYQKLREAYDFALNMAKYDYDDDCEEDFSMDDDVVVDSNEEESDIDFEYVDEPTDYEAEFRNHFSIGEIAVADNEKFIHDFMAQLESLYADFHRRIENENWEKLIESDLLWDLRLKKMITVRMFYFLTEHKHLPNEIWHTLDRNLSIQEAIANEDTIIYSTTFEFREFVKRQFNGKTFGFQSLKHAKDIDIEAYLDQREAACQAIEEGDFERAKLALKAAKYIFSKDSELLKIKKYFNKAVYGEYHWLKRIISLRGRLSRIDFFMILLISTTVMYSLGHLFGIDSNISTIIFFIGFASIAKSIVLRLHDTGRSGVTLILIFIPYVGQIYLLYLLVKKGDKYGNEYGPSPKLLIRKL